MIRYGRISSSFLVCTLSIAAGCGHGSDPGEADQALGQHQACVVLPASLGRDAQIRQDKPGTNYGSLGHAQVGVTGQGANDRRMLIAFDLGAVPEGVQITSAGVEVQLDGGNAAFGIIDVHTVTAPWDEATVTWKSLGSSYSAAPAASFSDASFQAGKTVIDLLPVVRGWVSGGVPNHGVLLKKSPSTPTSVATFKTREGGSGATLTVCYEAADPCAGVTCAPRGACHEAGTCDPATGACSHPAKPDGTACDDGNACTQGDACQSGACAGGSPVACAAPDPCHEGGTCDPATGLCTTPARPDGTPCDDGDACTQADVCQDGACAGGSPVACTPIDDCHEAGTCDPATGACSMPPRPDGSACNDGDPCTQVDTCVDGLCVGSSPIACAPVDGCHEAGTCDPATGACSTPARPDGTPCDDGNACTSADACHAGACAGSPAVVCAAADDCHDAGACDPATGACSTPAKPDGTGCDDGDPCTEGDRCQAGGCVGAPAPLCGVNACVPQDCDDGVTCTVDTCVSGAGCQHRIACAPGASCAEDFCSSPPGLSPELAWICQ
jgi:hypothetical protein